jgi:hypothetical protein
MPQGMYMQNMGMSNHLPARLNFGRPFAEAVSHGLKEAPRLCGPDAAPHTVAGPSTAFRNLSHSLGSAHALMPS